MIGLARSHFVQPFFNFTKQTVNTVYKQIHRTKIAVHVAHVENLILIIQTINIFDTNKDICLFRKKRGMKFNKKRRSILNEKRL